jgi:hypothetical protein
MIADNLVQAQMPKTMKPHSDPSTAINCSVFRQSKINGDAHKKGEVLESSNCHDAVLSSPLDNINSPFLLTLLSSNSTKSIAYIHHAKQLRTTKPREQINLGNWQSWIWSRLGIIKRLTNSGRVSSKITGKSGVLGRRR